MSLYILAGVALVPLHGDESTQIYMGRDFYYHVQGDTEQILLADWDTLEGDGATEQQLRLLNGTLPKYLFGMVAYLSGYDIHEINQQWAWGLGWDWNHDNGHVPTDELLLRTRFVSALLLAVSAIALYGIGVLIAHRPIALIATAYYVLNPAVLINGRRAMMEGGMLAFSLLAVLLGLLAIRHRHWAWYLLLGIVSGLAVASKHTAVVTIFAVFLASGVYLLCYDKRKYLSVTKLIGAGIVSLLIFFALNPAWWQNPISAMQTVLDLRQDLLTGQVAFFGGYDTLQDRTTGFARQTFIVQPMYAESDFDSFLSNQDNSIRRYENSLFSGVSVGGSFVGGVILLVLSAIGLIRLWRDEQFDTATQWVLTLWLVVMFILTFSITPLEWQRYYLPIYPIIALLMAIGLHTSVATIGARRGLYAEK